MGARGSERKTPRLGVLPRAGLAGAAGASTVLGLAPFSVAPVAPAAFAALFLLLGRLSAGSAFLVGWVFGIGQFGVGTSWIAESFYVDADAFGALAIPAVAALSTGLAVFPALAAAAFRALDRRGRPGVIGSTLSFATAWTAAEWLRGHALTGFPWNLAGYALVDHDALRQAAAWVGSYGLGFLVVLVGALLGAALSIASRTRFVPLALCAAIVGSTWAAGALRLVREPPAPTGIDLRVVQGNVPQREKWAPGSRETALARYLALSTAPGERADPADVLLWPETAFPGRLDEDADARARIAAALADRVLLLTGAPARVRDGERLDRFNTVQAYDGAGRALASYAKHHLVPFGEYVPYRDWLPVERMVAGLSDFSPGPGPRTLVLPGVPPVAVAICYEIVFPGAVIDDASRPGWLFNATNDAWFGTSIGPEQHLAAARMRAVEEGVPVVRAANTGISAIVDADGRLLERLDIGETGVLDAPLPGARPATPYARFGDGTLLALVVSCWAAWWAVARSRAPATRRG